MSSRARRTQYPNLFYYKYFQLKDVGGTTKLTGPGVDVDERSERATLFRLRFSVLLCPVFGFHAPSVEAVAAGSFLKASIRWIDAGSNIATCDGCIELSVATIDNLGQ